jgi:hypothetical protein
MLHNWELGEQVHFLHTQNLAGHILSENHAFNSKSVLHTSCCTDPCFPGPVRARQCMPAYIVNWGNNFPQETRLLGRNYFSGTELKKYRN